MQPGFVGRPTVIAGIAVGSALLGLYFVGRFLMAGEDAMVVEWTLPRVVNSMKMTAVSSAIAVGGGIRSRE